MKVKKNFAITPETDFEIRKLAKAWGISIGKAWERCCHYAAYRRQKDENLPTHARLRQAEAQVEMLKAER